MADIYGDIIREQNEHKKRIKRLEEVEYPKLMKVAVPLTSASWNLTAYSTQAVSTLIDLSAVFGVPAGIRTVRLGISVRDSAVFPAGGLYIALGPTATYWYQARIEARGGDYLYSQTAEVNCDDGDVYYRLVASGALTFDVVIRVWGYVI